MLYVDASGVMKLMLEAATVWLRLEGYDPARVVVEEVDFGLKERP